MGRRIVAIEKFQDVSAASMESSPATSTKPAFHITGTINVDPLKRDMAVQDVVVDGGKKIHSAAVGPVATTAKPSPSVTMPAPNQNSGCPDMSQYIRMDEIPCWNCTLP